jgi:four helix bundle protein
MAPIERFEDITAWKQARILANRVYDVSSRGEFARDFALKDQVRRSANSVMGNIAEGFGRRTHRDFAGFLYYSKSSAFETQSHLHLAWDRKYISDAEHHELIVGYRGVHELLVKLIRYLEGTPRP